VAATGGSSSGSNNSIQNVLTDVGLAKDDWESIGKVHF